MRLALLSTLTMIAFAANSVLNRMALADELIDPMVFGAVRVLSGAAMLAALVLWRQGGLALGGGGRALPVAALLIYVFGFSAAYVALDAGLGALILFGMVQVTMFAAALLRREAVPVQRWIGAGLALAGLGLLLAPGPAGGLPVASISAAGLMAVAGIGWGLYSLAGRGEENPLAATAANFVLAAPVALVMGAMAVAIGAGALPVTAAGLALAVVSGTITSGLGYALWYSILPRLGATRAAVAQLTVPVIAACGGLVLLGEAPDLRFAISAALVLSGVGLSLLPGRRGV